MNTTTETTEKHNGAANGKAKRKPLDLSAEPAVALLDSDGRVPNQFFPALHIDRIDVLPGQPRTRFDAVEELAEDIKVRGILQPVLVRVHPAGDGRFALVFGERRLRAAKLAGLETIPALFRDLTDGEALEVQIVENAKRRDIHPLEEADAYLRLRDTHGYTAEEIAAKVGKSIATIRQRLTYANLDENSRQAFFDGKLTAATALVIARMPDAQRPAVAKRIIDAWTEIEGPCSLYDANDIVNRQFMLRLADAPFSRTAEMACAGACSSCPKRTGAQVDLFGDLETKDDLCLDKTCFEQKVDEDFKAKAAAAREKGTEVLSGKKAAGLFAYGGKLATWGAGADYEIASTKEGKAAIKAGGTAVLVQNDRGAAVELVRKPGAAKPAAPAKEKGKAKGEDPATTTKKAGPDIDEDELCVRAAEQAMKLGSKIESALWPLVTKLFTVNSDAVGVAGFDRVLPKALKAENSKLKYSEMRDQAMKVSAAEAKALLFAVTVADVVFNQDPEELALLKRAGIDVARIEADMRKELETKATSASPKPAKAKPVTATPAKPKPKPAPKAAKAKPAKPTKSTKSTKSTKKK